MFRYCAIIQSLYNVLIIINYTIYTKLVTTTNSLNRIGKNNKTYLVI